MFGLVFFLNFPYFNDDKDQGLSPVTGDVTIKIIAGDVVVTRDHEEKKAFFSEHSYSFIPIIIFILSVAAINLYFYKKKE